MGVKIISSAIPRETVDALFWTILFKGCMLVEVKKAHVSLLNRNVKKRTKSLDISTARR